jgi:hypothetical protein
VIRVSPLRSSISSSLLAHLSCGRRWILSYLHSFFWVGTSICPIFHSLLLADWLSRGVLCSIVPPSGFDRCSLHQLHLLVDCLYLMLG